MMSFGPETLRAALDALPVTPPLWVAFSGGADSLALLHAATALGPVSAVHVDHGLHPDSEAWAAHCASVCRSLAVPLHVERVAVTPRGEGVEAAARHARYAVFERVLADGGTLLTAHHRDDQAETVLLRLFRGSGLDGLAGMPAYRPVGGGMLARPLLGATRAELIAYVRSSGLDWLDDPANRDRSFDRNFLRHELLPRLETRWPDVAARVARAAGHARDNRSTVADLCDAWLGDDETVDVERLRARQPDVRAMILRRWLERRGLRPPGRNRLERGLSDLLDAGPDRQPELRWADARIRRHAGRLWLLPATLPAVPERDYPGHGPDPVTVADVGRLCFSRASGTGLAPEAIAGAWRLRFRSGGERLRLHGVDRRVKDLLRESGLPPWERARLPLLRVGERVVCVPGVAVADDCAREGGYLAVWEPFWRARRQR